MSSKFTKFFVMLTFIFAVFEQTLAYAQDPCEMTVDMHSLMPEKAMSENVSSETSMSHSMPGMSHSMEDMTPDEDMKCCESDCTCPTNACSSWTFMPSTTSAALTLLNTYSTVSEPNLFKNTYLEQSKRPPKFA